MLSCQTKRKPFLGTNTQDSRLSRSVTTPIISSINGSLLCPLDRKYSCFIFPFVQCPAIKEFCLTITFVLDYMLQPQRTLWSLTKYFLYYNLAQASWGIIYQITALLCRSLVEPFNLKSSRAEIRNRIMLSTEDF